ncbi:helix-turn-helix domain-containing protein [Niabella hirudinis]|uniref:helix-turn-helix domain-containing protein n=1 Tax=Niabella hirudinis TaxID=1285929 RepID=UPI003EBAA23B
MHYLKKKDGFQGQRSIIVPPPLLDKLAEEHPVMRQLYVTDIGYYPNAQYHYRERPQGTKEHVVIYCVNGKGICKVGGREYAVGPGELMLLPAHEPHEYHADATLPWSIYWVHFKGLNSQDFMNMMLRQFAGNLVLLSYRDDRIRLFEQIYTTLEKGYSIHNLCYAGLSLQYFLTTCWFDNYDQPPAAANEMGGVDGCIRFMRDNLDQTLSLQQIAAAANRSVPHIAALFKKGTGFAPIEYFNQLKVQRACQYLLYTDLRINEIAAKLGVEDPYYFTRMFTKIIGVSPLKYRKNRHG